MSGTEALARSAQRLRSARRGLLLELGVDPVHVRAQLAADRLDLVARLLLAHALEVLLAGAVLGDPFAGEVPGLDLGQDLPHCLAGLGADDPLAAGQVPVLGRIGYRISHPRDALFV